MDLLVSLSNSPNFLAASPWANVLVNTTTPVTIPKPDTTDSGWTIAYDAALLPGGTNESGAFPTSGDAAWVSDEAAESGHTASASAGTYYTLLVNGPANTTFTVECFSSSSFDVATRWRVNGGTPVTLGELNNTTQVARFVDVTTDANGDATIGFSKNTGFSRANAIRLIVPEAASGPTLSSVPATALPGQSRTVTGTGFGATQGTGGLTIGGVAQTITSWSDTEIVFTTVQGNNKYEAGKTLEVTTDAAETVSDTIELVADTASGFGYIDMLNPATSDESSVTFGATPTVVTGDQFEWEDFNNLGNLTVDAEGFVTNVDAEGTFRGRFWDATDSTWGSVGNFTAEVPVTPSAPGLLKKGNMRDIKVFSDAGVNKGSYNERAIKYYQSNGATSSQYNRAKKQFEDL